MGKVHPQITEALRQFIEAQKIFFVSTAPLNPDAHINISPKGMDTFRILSDNTAAYLDLTGSGIETVAHLKENARITLMFCAFQGRPNIVRLYGKGRVVELIDAEFAHLRSSFPPYEGVRSIIVVDVSRIADSCGYSIPRFVYEGERTQLEEWVAKRGPDGLETYRASKNRESIDGLPGLDLPNPQP